eukprot:Cvel_2813.t1-p1 / transcript=Cvel_2813.t1 / gene=Cvel_2813 / organism=Chromera_velia_CCMP2878 / gene_product=hypothetical protein / transcript_product=hypothetical protein / location=Cvel_scaffold113:34216-34572(-) / protein_length=119 / sequence_SO=supercontig / SO=protein_coding / is_pseudo=false
MMKQAMMAVLIAGLLIGAAWAHGETRMTTPADGATLDSAPETIELRFAEPSRVLNVQMAHRAGGANHTAKLDLPTRAPVETLVLEPDFMGPGAYRFSYRALGTDGHVMTGSFSFTVAGE